MAEYKNAIVSYIDFLGFENLIEQKTPDEIIEILNLMKERGSFASFVHNTTIEFSGPITSVATFSDHIIRQTQYEPIGLEAALGTEMPLLARMQFDLLTRMRDPLLIRGAISKGRSHVTRDFTFGPAMVKSYKLERIAQFSRIIIDFGLIGELLQQDRPGWDYILRRGDDGVFFIDYLNSVIKDTSYAPLSIRGRDNILAAHRGAVDYKLAELLPQKDEGLKQKALWLARYHNSVIERFIKEKPEDEAMLKPLMVGERKMLPT
jgi:hypothetical protein